MLFFFNQKTAYEMRISDWSSDGCSSDLRECGDIGQSIAEMVRGSVFIPLACRAVSRSCSFLPCWPTGGPGMTWPVVYLQGYMRSRWTCGVMERVRRVPATTV